MDKLVDLLGKAAEIVGVQAVRLWPQLVGITFVQSVFWSVVSVVAIVAVIWAECWFGFKAFPRLWKWAVEGESSPYSDGGCYVAVTFLVLVAGIAGALFLWGLLSALATNLPGVFYPEAQAVINLARQLKS
jgi:hypothetical protein